jgi:hypothetical protein
MMMHSLSHGEMDRECVTRHPETMTTGRVTAMPDIELGSTANLRFGHSLGDEVGYL